MFFQHHSLPAIQNTLLPWHLRSTNINYHRTHNSNFNHLYLIVNTWEINFTKTKSINCKECAIEFLEFFYYEWICLEEFCDIRRLRSLSFGCNILILPSSWHVEIVRRYHFVRLFSFTALSGQSEKILCPSYLHQWNKRWNTLKSFQLINLSFRLHFIVNYKDDGI